MCIPKKQLKMDEINETGNENSISIVLPMYNEEENAHKIVTNLKKTLGNCTIDHEIVIVESGSTDNTSKIVDELEKKIPNIKVFHQIKKEGLGSAIRLGMSKATKNLVLYMDSDDPFDTNIIKNALPLTKNFSLVVGYRTGKRENLKRRVYSIGYNKLIRFVFGLKVKDVNFSFKLLKKELLEKMNLNSNGFFIDAEILLEAKRNGAKMAQIPILYKIRENGSSSVGNLDTIFNILAEMYRYKKTKDGNKI